MKVRRYGPFAVSALHLFFVFLSLSDFSYCLFVSFNRHATELADVKGTAEDFPEYSSNFKTPFPQLLQDEDSMFPPLACEILCLLLFLENAQVNRVQQDTDEIDEIKKLKQYAKDLEKCNKELERMNFKPSDLLSLVAPHPISSPPSHRFSNAGSSALSETPLHKRKVIGVPKTAGGPQKGIELEP
jgi:hypothetical protein